jgi:nucleotide-binding universal stress UspA family protein
MTSSIKQVLVHLDATRAAPLRLAAARSVAQQQGAALAALYATTPIFLELPYAPEVSSGIAASLMQIDDERRTATRKVFDETMRTPGPIASWADTSEVPMLAAFNEQAFYADLVVVGQRDREDVAAAAVPPDFAEAVAMGSGRPTLVIPTIGVAGPVGNTVAIAWKPTREAARAVQAAMPLLEHADSVHVLTWDEEPYSEVEGSRLDLDTYLRAHGVEATWHRGGQAPEALGDIVLSRAFDLGVDLLVMGCYGHTRAREWVLGGTTRTILQTMTMPVLMAH